MLISFCRRNLFILENNILSNQLPANTEQPFFPFSAKMFCEEIFRASKHKFFRKLIDSLHLRFSRVRLLLDTTRNRRSYSIIVIDQKMKIFEDFRLKEKKYILIYISSNSTCAYLWPLFSGRLDAKKFFHPLFRNVYFAFNFIFLLFLVPCSNTSTLYLVCVHIGARTKASFMRQNMQHLRTWESGDNFIRSAISVCYHLHNIQIPWETS